MGMCARTAIRSKLIRDRSGGATKEGREELQTVLLQVE